MAKYEKETSLVDDLGSAWDDLSEDETEETLSEVTEEEEEVLASDDDEEAAEDTVDDEEGEDSEDTLSAPDHWPEEDREFFDSLDTPELKEKWLNKTKSLESGYQQKFEELAEERKYLGKYKDVDEAIAPYREALQAEGVDEATYLKKIIAAHHMIVKDPVEGIKWLAQSYGVNMAGLVPQQKEDEEDEDDYLDPAVSRRLEKLESRQNQFAQQVQNSEQSKVIAAVTEFSEAKDEEGNPRHPHFEQVRAHMGALMSSGAAKSMEDAYDQAVWAVPTLRDERLKQQESVANKDRESRRKSEVAKAKKVKNVKTSKTPATDKRAPAKSWSDELAANWDELTEAS